MIKWFQTYRIHFLAWILFVIWETVIVWLFSNKHPDAAIIILHYGATIIVFYISSRIILPLVNGLTNHVVGTMASLIIFFLIYLLLHFIADVILVAINPALKKNFEGPTQRYIIANSYRALYFFVISLAYYYLTEYVAANKKQLQLVVEQKKIEQELLTTQNLYLQAQINPHFLFNTLHFINAQLPQESQASEAILKLSKIMHFAFSQQGADHKIRIGDELMQIEELIALQKLRGSKYQNLELHYDLLVCNLHVIPLVLLTLAENIYKHADLREESAILSLELADHKLEVTTKNRIQYFDGPSDQTGLKNLRRRLETSYGKQSQFKTQQQGAYFMVYISVPVRLLAS